MTTKTKTGYRIRVEPNWYAGSLYAPHTHWLADYNMVVRIFATREAAQAVVDDYYNTPSHCDGVPACNVLSHGQYAADTMTIHRHKVPADYAFSRSLRYADFD